MSAETTADGCELVEDAEHIGMMGDGGGGLGLRGGSAENYDECSALGRLLDECLCFFDSSLKYGFPIPC